MKGFLCLIAGCLAVAGLANDGWVGYSGAPRIEGKHPTIRMMDEVIHIKVGKDRMTADCRFTFKNEGAACNARIGFPDWDSHGEEDNRSIYTSFASYVDGKRARVKLVASTKGERWQVKTVAFKKGQTRRIRNVYSMMLGIISLGGPGRNNQAPRMRHVEYILATGRSWKGTIGKSTVTVEFQRLALVRNPIRLALRTEEQKFDDSSFWSKNRGLVLWDGPAKPRVEGRKIRFVRTNWEPTTDDDVSLKFGLYFRNY